MAFEDAVAGHQVRAATCAIGIADTGETPTLIEAAARARRRMKVVQAVRKHRRRGDGAG